MNQSDYRTTAESIFLQVLRSAKENPTLFHSLAESLPENLDKKFSTKAIMFILENLNNSDKCNAYLDSILAKYSNLIISHQQFNFLYHYFIKAINQHMGPEFLTDRKKRLIKQVFKTAKAYFGQTQNKTMGEIPKLSAQPKLNESRLDIDLGFSHQPNELPAKLRGNIQQLVKSQIRDSIKVEIEKNIESELKSINKEYILNLLKESLQTTK